MEMPQQKMPAGKKILIGLIVVVFIVIVSALVDKDTQAANLKLANLHAASSALERKDITEDEIKKLIVPAEKVVLDYEVNEIKADEDFKGKVLYVAGSVGDIQKDVLEHTYVTLQAGKTFRKVQCYLNNEKLANQINKGQQIVVRGTCGGLMMNVVMKDCEVLLAE